MPANACTHVHAHAYAHVYAHVYARVYAHVHTPALYRLWISAIADGVAITRAWARQYSKTTTAARAFQR